jgi:hypothetical protein
LVAIQSQNPQRSPASSAVLLNRRKPIWPKSERNLLEVIYGLALKKEFMAYFLHSWGSLNDDYAISLNESLCCLIG